jgi:probable HAF family extracellular repeat protein
VVGSAERLELIDGEEYPVPHPFIWDAANGIRELGTLGGYGGFATDINNLGQVVGYADLPSGYERAFIWDEAAGMRSLPAIGGGSTRAIAINDQGQVLGGASGVGAFIWDAVNGVQMIPIGGRDINNSGHVVGGTVAGDLAIWDQRNGVQVLADLFPPNTGWRLDIVFAMNDAGEIVGNGLLNGKLRGFVLTPVPEPSSSVFLVSAVLLFSVSSRLRSKKALGRGRYR